MGCPHLQLIIINLPLYVKEKSNIFSDVRETNPSTTALPVLTIADDLSQPVAVMLFKLHLHPQEQSSMKQHLGHG